MAKLFNQFKQLVNTLNSLEYSDLSAKRSLQHSSNGVQRVRKDFGDFCLDIVVSGQEVKRPASASKKVLQKFRLAVVLQRQQTHFDLREIRLRLFAGQRELASDRLNSKPTIFDELRPGRYLLRLDRKRVNLGDVILNLS